MRRGGTALVPRALLADAARKVNDGTMHSQVGGTATF
jgi:hypothetical protein